MFSVSLRRQFVGAIGVLTAAVSIWAATSPASAAVSGTISFASTTNLQPAHSLMVANFKKAYPDVKVNETYLASAQLQTLLQTQLQAGTAPDIVYMNYGPSSLPLFNLAKAGRLANLAGSPWAKTTIPGQMRNLVQSGKNLYAPVLQMVPSTMLYNAGAFKQLGLKVPKTMAQFLALCKTINAKSNYIPIAHAGGQVSGNIQFTLPMAANYVYGPEPGWNIKRAKGKVSFSTSSGWKKVLQRVVDMKNAGCFGPGTAGTTNATVAHSQVATERALMTGSSAGDTIAKSINPKLQYGTFALPADKASKTYLNVSPNSTIGINAKTKNMEASKAFINFVMRPDQQRVRAKAGYGIATIDYIKGKTPSHLASLKTLLKKKKTRIDYYIQLGGFPNTGVFNALGGEMTGLFTGQSTVTSILAKMDAAAK